MEVRRFNEVLEDHGDWLLVDISTFKHPYATMAVDTDVFNGYNCGYISAHCKKENKYIYATYKLNKVNYYFHRYVIDFGDRQCGVESC